jgi:hypothetical protein
MSLRVKLCNWEQEIQSAINLRALDRCSQDQNDRT